MQTAHFPYPNGLPQYNSLSPNITIRVGFGMQLAKSPTCPLMRLIFTFVALCDDNPAMLQTDDVILHSMSR